MARIDNKALFFTTSPRTPAKMIRNQLLHELFEGRMEFNDTRRIYNSLAQSDFSGVGSPTDKL